VTSRDQHGDQPEPPHPRDDATGVVICDTVWNQDTLC